MLLVSYSRAGVWWYLVVVKNFGAGVWLFDSVLMHLTCCVQLGYNIMVLVPGCDRLMQCCFFLLSLDLILYFGAMTRTRLWYCTVVLFLGCGIAFWYCYLAVVLY